MTEPYLIANRWRCPDGTILQSKHRYDYVEYCDTEGNYYFVDGGLQGYIRTSGNLENVCVYSCDPFEEQRKFFCWGSYGRDGDEPIRYIPLMELTDEHIRNILLTQHRLSAEIKDLFIKEQTYRDIYE